MKISVRVDNSQGKHEVRFCDRGMSQVSAAP